MLHHDLGIALVCVAVLAVLGLGFLAGRKWRRDYKHALDQWQNLQSAARASATASATSHGNQVVLNVDRSSEHESSVRGFWLPDSVRPGLDSGAPVGQEALGSGDDGVVHQPDGLYRPTRVSRVLFGSGRPDRRRDVGRESGSSGDGG